MQILIDNRTGTLAQILVFHDALKKQGFASGANGVPELLVARAVQLATRHRVRYEKRTAQNKPITNDDKMVMEFLGDTITALDPRLSLRIDFGTCRVAWHSEASGLVKLEIPTWG